MKRNMQFGCIGLIWLMAAVGAWCANVQLKIATVDLAQVFDSYGKTKTAELALKEEEEKVRVERTQMLEKARAMEKEYLQVRDEAQSPLISAEARDKKRREAEDKLMDTREYEGKIRRLLEVREKQLNEQLIRSRKMIVEEIKSAVAEFARRSGYDLILDSSGQTMNGISIVVYTGPSVDVTEAVIQMINLPSFKAGTNFIQ